MTGVCMMYVMKIEMPWTLRGEGIGSPLFRYSSFFRRWISDELSVCMNFFLSVIILSNQGNRGSAYYLMKWLIVLNLMRQLFRTIDYILCNKTNVRANVLYMLMIFFTHFFFITSILHRCRSIFISDFVFVDMQFSQLVLAYQVGDLFVVWEESSEESVDLVYVDGSGESVFYISSLWRRAYSNFYHMHWGDQ